MEELNKKFEDFSEYLKTIEASDSTNKKVKCPREVSVSVTNYFRCMHEGIFGIIICSVL